MLPMAQNTHAKACPHVLEVRKHSEGWLLHSAQCDGYCRGMPALAGALSLSACHTGARSAGETGGQHYLSAGDQSDFF